MAHPKGAVAVDDGARDLDEGDRAKGREEVEGPDLGGSRMYGYVSSARRSLANP